MIEMPNRDRNAGQHAEQGDTQEGREGYGELGRSLTVQAHCSRHVGEADRGDDDHRGERRLGQELEQPGHEDEHRGDDRRAYQTSQLRSCAGTFGNRRARSARADREALEEAGRDVRRADADHLAVGMDFLLGARCEGGRGRDRVGQRHDGYAQGAGDQQTYVRQGNEWNRQRRESGWQRPDQRDAGGTEVERDDDGHRRDDGNQHGWDLGQPAATARP